MIYVDALLSLNPRGEDSMPGSGALGTPWCVQIVGRLHILLRKELLCGRHVLECGERSYRQNEVNRLEVDVLNSAWKLSQ